MATTLGLKLVRGLLYRLVYGGFMKKALFIFAVVLMFAGQTFACSRNMPLTVSTVESNGGTTGISGTATK
jgi:hypothetical protein